jgi:glucose/arabinose dehydrogenase
MPAHKAVLAGALLALTAIASPANAQLAQATLVPGNFTRPVYVTGASDTPGLLFVVEKAGVIQVLQNEVQRPTPFLDIQTRVSSDGERGLLSVAFAPDYATSRLFYVAFTNLTGDIELDEFQRSPTNAFRAVPGSRRRLLSIRHRDATNHNGGQLQFGPDGLLYMSTGDGGQVFPRGKFARNLNSLLGKILRIDPAPDGASPYTIPPTNPYFGMTDRRGEIFAYGLRNPWRFSFNGHRIAIGDVGQGDWEEINFLNLQSARGANFGWPAFEGNVPYDPDQPTPPDDPTFPMHTYSHDGGGCAVISGYVSQDPDIPALSRRYVYGDFCTGEIRSFVPDVADQEARADRFVLQAASVTSFGIGPDQRMYFTQNGGELMRIDPLP